MKKISLIVAREYSGGIGIFNSIPWKVKKDMTFFKNLTINNTVIMGKNTFESLNYKPLKNRINIVLTTTLDKKDYNYDNLFFFDDLDDAISFAHIENEMSKRNEIFIIGGQTLYNLMTSIYYREMISYFYITEILQNFECDTFFHHNSIFESIYVSEKYKTKEGIEFIFNKYRLKNNIQN